MCGLRSQCMSSYLDSGAPHFRHLLCVGDAQSANRSVERLEGDRHLRLQRNDHVGRRNRLPSTPSVRPDEHVLRCHIRQRVRVCLNNPDARVWTEGMHVLLLRICNRKQYVMFTALPYSTNHNVIHVI